MVTGLSQSPEVGAWPVASTVKEVCSSAFRHQGMVLNWFAPLAASKPRLFLTHGEAKGREPLARLIQERHGLTAEQPFLGQTIEL